MAPTDAPGITESSARYLVAAFRLWAARGGRVATGEVARDLAVEPSSATEMLAKLADAGYLDLEAHHGVEPTTRGVTLARAISRRGCVVEAFFDDLGAPIGPERAQAIGCHLPERAVARLGEAGEHPCRDRCRAGEDWFDDERCPKLGVLEAA